LFLPLSEHKASRYYLFSSYLTSLLNTKLYKSSRILRTRATDLCTELSLFFSSHQSQFQVLATEPVVSIGADPWFNAQECIKKTLNTSSFGNTYEVDEVSPEVEAGMVAGLQ
jgi:hypothetical protein